MTPEQILDLAISQYGQDPKRPFIKIVALFSGGYDSAVTAHAVSEWAKQRGLSDRFVVLSVDTLLSADGWREYVASYAQRVGWPHEIFDNPEGGWYRQWVTANGFPFSRKGHTIAYQRLKERAIMAWMASQKAIRFERVLFCSGIRQSESSEREKLTNPVNIPSRGGSAIYANPIFYFSEAQKLKYMDDHDLPRDNPFYETLGGSGDCYCNWGQFTTMETMQRHSPNRAAEIAEYEGECKKKHGWGWGEKPSDYAMRIREGNMPMFTEEGNPILCYGCRREKPQLNSAADNVAIDRMEWENDTN
jgi:3'-phosphoadenosine 5'-phosphosulfate sulfotransferase (PAPS reductase)/FAD synthetase